MRFAYADPPYPGCAGYYPENEEVDQAALLARLVAEYPDGWALSTHAPALRALLPLCPDDVRVGAWVKPFTPFRPNVGVAYAWEPVLWRGGRRRTRRQATAFDWLRAHGTLKYRVGLIGAKPEAFCFWLFELLNLEPGDTLDDLYPGTGAVTDAWGRWQRRLDFAPAAPEPPTQPVLVEP